MDQHQLKAAGLKVTTPRIRILHLLSELDQPHASAEQLYQILREQGDDIGLATVYRVLTQFEQAGLVERHFFAGNQAVFELADENHHDHLVCVDCGKVLEFTNHIIENERKKVAQKLGFDLSAHTLNLYGKCLEENCPSRPLDTKEC